jgi:hypothetical protein
MVCHVGYSRTYRRGLWGAGWGATFKGGFGVEEGGGQYISVNDRGINITKHCTLTF